MVNSPLQDGGEKRPMEIDDGGVVKRRRKEAVSGEEDEMRRVAELVLVLSAMGKMRGGSEPMAVEAAMMAEAREKVVPLCEKLPPKDIVPREAFGGVIDDLGLSRLKDQRLGFRPPKLSISQKIALSNRRMEESKAFASQSVACSSQRVQSGSGTAGETCGTPPPASMFSAVKAGQIPASSSSGTFQPPSSAVPPPAVLPPVVHVSTAASTPLHMRSTEARLPLASPSALNNTGKNSTSLAPPKVDRAHIRPDGRLNGPSFVQHVPADRHMVRTKTIHRQPQPASRIIVGSKNKAPDQLPVSTVTKSSPQMTAQSLIPQSPKTVVNQAASGSMPMMHHPVQSFQYSHPPVVNRHLEISRVVPRLLNLKLPQRPAWTLPSRDYMSKAHPCQFCKLMINEVENVVICDACEKAFHVGCLQSHNAKNIPRGEWQCPRCLAMSHGKPFPPKYGRVTRNMNAPKGPSNATMAQFPSDNKKESLNKKMAEPNDTTIGNPVVMAKSQIIKASVPPSGSNMLHESHADRIGISIGIEKEDRSNSGPCPDKIEGAAVLSMSNGSSSHKPHLHAAKSEVSHSEDGFVSKTGSSTPVTQQANNASDNMPTASNLNNFDHKVSTTAESPLLRRDDSNGFAESNHIYGKERCENDAAQQNVAVKDGGQVLVEEIINTLDTGLHNVDLIGDADRVLDAKKFYQSCRINGVVYCLQDYALFRSSNGKLTPLRLQGMWEDSLTKSKWLLVRKCYFPDDLPQEAGHPGAPQSNEVYESIHDSNMMAGLIQGPCEVLPFKKFGEESEINIQGFQENDRMRPVFIRNWFYDELKQAFRPSAS